MPKQNKEIYSIFSGGSGTSENGLLQLVNKNSIDPNGIAMLAMFKYFYGVNGEQDMSFSMGSFDKCHRCGNYAADATSLSSNVVFMTYSTGDYRSDNVDKSFPFLSRIDGVYRDMVDIKGILNSLTAGNGKRLSFAWPLKFERSPRLTEVVAAIDGVHCTTRGSSPDIEVSTGKNKGLFIRLYYKDGCVSHYIDDYSAYFDIAKARGYNQKKVVNGAITLLLYELLNEMFFRGFFSPLMHCEVNRFKTMNACSSGEQARLILPEDTVIKWCDYVSMSLLRNVDKKALNCFKYDALCDLCPDYLVNIDGVNVIKRALNMYEGYIG